MTQMRTTRWPDERPQGTWRARIRPPVNELAKAWAHFFGRVPWVAMVTLTFDSKRIFSISRARASRHAWWWCASLGGIVRRPIAWLYATEQGRNGAWHVHALVAGLSVGEVRSAAEMWRLARGIAHVTDVKEGERAVLYVAKGIPYHSEVVFSDTIDIYRERLRDDVIVQLREEACPCPAGDVTRRSLRSSAVVPAEHGGMSSRPALSSRVGMDGHGEGCEQLAGLDSDLQGLLARLFDGYFRELQPRGSKSRVVQSDDQAVQLDAGSQCPQTGTLPELLLTIEPDLDGHVMAEVVRIVLEEMREAPLDGD
jgi:hypothetical protein